MKLKKKEDQSVDTSLLLRMGNKIPMGGVTETKFRAETEARTIQRLPHQGIHPIYNHQTQTLLHMPERFCWQDPDIALLWGYVSAWQIQKWMLTVIFWMEHRDRNEEARESTQGAKGVCNPIGGTTIWTNQYPHPQGCVSSCMCSRGWPSQSSIGGEALGLVKIICPNTAECQGKEVGVGGLESRAGEEYRGLWDSIWNVNEENI